MWSSACVSPIAQHRFKVICRFLTITLKSIPDLTKQFHLFPFFIYHLQELQIDKFTVVYLLPLDTWSGMVAKANRKSACCEETPAERLIPEWGRSNDAYREAGALTYGLRSKCSPLQASIKKSFGLFWRSPHLTCSNEHIRSLTGMAISSTP